MTPYEFDKILWLIGSGRFYRTGVDDEDGQFTAVEIGRQADAFIRHMASATLSNASVADELADA